MANRNPVRLFRAEVLPFLVLGTLMIGCSSAWNAVLVFVVEPSWLRVLLVLMLLAVPTTLAAGVAVAFAWLRSLRRRAAIVAGPDEMLAWSPAGLDEWTRGVLVLTPRTLRFVSSNGRTDRSWPVDAHLRTLPRSTGLSPKLEIRTVGEVVAVHVVDPKGWSRAIAEGLARAVPPSDPSAG